MTIGTALFGIRVDQNIGTMTSDLVVSPKLEHFHEQKRHQHLPAAKLQRQCVSTLYSSQHQRTNMSAPSSQQQSTRTLHRHFNLFVTTLATPRVTHVIHVGDMWQARYCGNRDSANHSRTSSSNSLLDLVGFSSSSGASSDDDSELPQLECIEHTAVECRQCRPFPASHGCRPCTCRFSWPDLDLRPAARRQHDLCVQILSNGYCPLVEGGTRDSVMYCGARCYCLYEKPLKQVDFID